MASLTAALALKATCNLLCPSSTQVVLTQQHLRLGVSHLLSLRSYAADQQADRKDATPDPFLPHLQHKTEKDLLDLLSKNQQQISRSMLEDDDDDVEEPLPATGEIGGPAGAARGAEPTRYGDWEKGGRCSDF